MKKILLISTLMLLTACGQHVYEKDIACTAELPVSEQAGILLAYKTDKITDVYALTSVISSTSETIGKCSPIMCKDGYTLQTFGIQTHQAANSSLKPQKLEGPLENRLICVPVKRCSAAYSYRTIPFLGFNYSPLFYDPTSSEQDSAIHKVEETFSFNESVCSSEELPTECEVGFVLNSNTNSCVQENVACTAEEMDQHAVSGHKIFNTETNSYNACVIESCIEMYSVSSDNLSCIDSACMADPQSSPSCPGYIENDPCVIDPQSNPSCPGYVEMDPCITDPFGMACQCWVDPGSPGCL